MKCVVKYKGFRMLALHDGADMDKYMQFAKVNIAENKKLAKKYFVDKRQGKVILF